MTPLLYIINMQEAFRQKQTASEETIFRSMVPSRMLWKKRNVEEERGFGLTSKSKCRQGEACHMEITGFFMFLANIKRLHV